MSEYVDFLSLKKPSRAIIFANQQRRLEFQVAIVDVELAVRTIERASLFSSSKRRNLDSTQLQEKEDQATACLKPFDLFPLNSEDDAVFGNKLMATFFAAYGPVHDGKHTSNAIFDGIVGKDSIILELLLHYFMRNGVGSPYMESLKLLMEFLRASEHSMFREHSWGTEKLKAKQRNLEDILVWTIHCVLDRVQSLYPHEDCTLMLRILKTKLYEINCLDNSKPQSPVVEPRTSARSPTTEYKRARKLRADNATLQSLFSVAMDLTSKYPDSTMVDELYLLANEIYGPMTQVISLDFQEPALARTRHIAHSLINASHSDDVKLRIICELLKHEDNDTQAIFIAELFGFGVRIARKLGLEESFMMSVGNSMCFVRPDTVLQLFKMKLAHPINVIVERASARVVGAMHCLLQCFMPLNAVLSEVKYIRHYTSLTEAHLDLLWEMRNGVRRFIDQLITKTTEVFSVNLPRGSLRLRIKTDKPFVEVRSVDSSDLFVEPFPSLYSAWISQLVDDRFSWEYREAVGEALMDLTKRRPLKVARPDLHNAWLNSVIWLNDLSRFREERTMTAAELDAVENLRKLVRGAPILPKYQVRVILLMTLLRAPAVLPRLRNSNLRMLPLDLLRLLEQSYLRGNL